VSEDSFIDMSEVRRGEKFLIGTATTGQQMMGGFVLLLALIAAVQYIMTARDDMITTLEWVITAVIALVGFGLSLFYFRAGPGFYLLPGKEVAVVQQGAVMLWKKWALRFGADELSVETKQFTDIRYYGLYTVHRQVFKVELVTAKGYRFVMWRALKVNRSAAAIAPFYEHIGGSNI